MLAACRGVKATLTETGWDRLLDLRASRPQPRSQAGTRTLRGPDVRVLPAEHAHRLRHMANAYHAVSGLWCANVARCRPRNGPNCPVSPFVALWQVARRRSAWPAPAARARATARDELQSPAPRMRGGCSKASGSAPRVTAAARSGRPALLASRARGSSSTWCALSSSTRVRVVVNQDRPSFDGLKALRRRRWLVAFDPFTSSERVVRVCYAVPRRQLKTGPREFSRPRTLRSLVARVRLAGRSRRGLPICASATAIRLSRS
jgi:hypothetical protein